MLDNIKQIPLISFDFHETSDMLEIDMQGLHFEQIAQNIRKAVVTLEEKTLFRKCNCEITVLRIEMDDKLITLAVRDFAGIIEEEAEVSIFLCREEEIERIGRTIRLNKEDNTIVKGELYSFPYLSPRTYLMYGGKLEYKEIEDTVFGKYVWRSCMG